MKLEKNSNDLKKDLDDFDRDERADFYACLCGFIIYSFLLIAVLGIFLYYGVKLCQGQ